MTLDTRPVCIAASPSSLISLLPFGKHDFYCAIKGSYPLRACSQSGILSVLKYSNTNSNRRGSYQPNIEGLKETNLLTVR